MIAQLASRSHGVVTRRALLAAGVTVGELKHRLQAGCLIRVFPGVYRAGHVAPSLDATYMAAVSACGKGAVLRERAAGHLLRLLSQPPGRPEVWTLTERRIDGIDTRRARRAQRRDVTTWRGIPVTTPARTLVDLAAVLSPDELARACHEAGIRHGTTPDQIEDALSRKPNARNARVLRRMVHGDDPLLLSELERQFLRVLSEHGLPLPETNRRAGGHVVDCRWPDHALTVELDGYRYHRSRHAWEQDRRRERAARARGDDFRRYTYGDVFEDRRLMLAELAALLPR